MLRFCEVFAALRKSQMIHVPKSSETSGPGLAICICRGPCVFDVWGEVSLQRTSEHLEGCQVGFVWFGLGLQPGLLHRVRQVRLSALEVDLILSGWEGGDAKLRQGIYSGVFHVTHHTFNMKSRPRITHWISLCVHRCVYVPLSYSSTQWPCTFALIMHMWSKCIWLSYCIQERCSLFCLLTTWNLVLMSWCGFHYYQ